MATIDAQGNMEGTGSIVPSTPVSPQIPPAAPITTNIPGQTDTQRSAAYAAAGQQTPDQLKLANAGKPGYDVFGNATGENPDTALQSRRAAGGTFQSNDGNYYYNFDNSKAPAPTSTTAPTTGGTGISSIGGTPTTQTTVPSTGNSQVDALEQARQNTADALAAAGKQVSDTILNIQNGTTPLTAGEQAQLDGLKGQFDTLIHQQTLQNTGAFGTAQTRGYQGGAAEYDPTFQAKTIGSVISAGASKIADLQVKEAAAVAQLTQGFKDKDIAAVKDAYTAYQDAAKARSDALTNTIKDTQDAIKTAQDQLQKAKDDFYNQVTKPIQDIGLKAAEAGASADILAKIKGAQTVDEAISAAGSSIQTSTNPDIAQYLFYKQQATNSGVVPKSYDEYQKAQNAIKNQQAYSEAFSKAAGTAAGTASVTPTFDSNTPGSGLGGTTGGGSILSAAGLSLAAFNYLTQGTASMSRMTASQRAAIMGEAQKWLNSNNIDVSTFQSQYKAYNDVLSKNIQRSNQTKVMAGEVSGSADALVSAIEANGGINKKTPGYEGTTGIGSLRAVDVLQITLGNAVNNKFAQTYKTQLAFVANDLAGYLAAARGATSPELQDQRDASEIIANGMNSGSLTAFKDAINANEGKVSGVVQNAVTDTQKQVWGLFGVAGKYASPINTTDVMLQDSKNNPLNLPQDSNSSNNPLGI